MGRNLFYSHYAVFLTKYILTEAIAFFTSAFVNCSETIGIPLLPIFCLDGHIRIPPNVKYKMFIYLYQSCYKITLFLVSKISFVQKVYPFTLNSKYFSLYFIFAYFMLYFLFSFAFGYTCL